MFWPQKLHDWIIRRGIDLLTPRYMHFVIELHQDILNLEISWLTYLLRSCDPQTFLVWSICCDPQRFLDWLIWLGPMIPIRVIIEFQLFLFFVFLHMCSSCDPLSRRLFEWSVCAGFDSRNKNHEIQNRCVFAHSKILHHFVWNWPSVVSASVDIVQKYDVWRVLIVVDRLSDAADDLTIMTYQRSKLYCI